jgi:hypothetical protein
MPPAVTYLLLALLGAVFLAAVWLDTRRESARLAPYRRFSLVLQLGALAGAILVLRPGRGNVRSPEALDQALGSGVPVLIDVFSNW